MANLVQTYLTNQQYSQNLLLHLRCHDQMVRFFVIDSKSGLEPEHIHL